MVKSIYLVLALVILALCNGISLEAKGRRNGRINNGHLAEPGAFPYMVSLRDENSRHLCGGAIIGPRTVLTTAFFIYGRNSTNIFIRAGSNQLNYSGNVYDTDSVNIPSFYIHQFYYPENDIALVYTIIPFEITPLIQSIPYSHTEIGPNVIGRFAGWGRTFSQGLPVNDLRTVQRETITVEFCDYIFDFIADINETHLCTGYGRLCLGDEGGPLVVDGEIIAVYSWGIGCGAGMPDIYTRISSFASWIDSNLL